MIWKCERKKKKKINFWQPSEFFYRVVKGICEGGVYDVFVCVYILFSSLNFSNPLVMCTCVV